VLQKSFITDATDAKQSSWKPRPLPYQELHETGGAAGSERPTT
jgi:hypothetical protein